MYEKYKWQFWFIVGLASVFVFLLPYYMLGENAYMMIHDELDDGIFKYVLYAKNFGVNGNFIPEFMGGQNRYTITVSSFFGVLIYKLFEPLTAFNVMLTCVVLTGYVGVYLLGKEISDNAFASFFAAAVFSYLPFKSMFALNIVGFPLLLWALILLGKNTGKKTVIPFIAVVYYSLGTTLAWGGYMSVGFLSLAIIVLLAVKVLFGRREDKKLKENAGKSGNENKDKAVKENAEKIIEKNVQSEKINTKEECDKKDDDSKNRNAFAFKYSHIINLIISDAIIIVIQILTSLDLIVNTFGKNAVLSHREEIIPNSRADVLNHFKDMMFVGGSHSECCSMYIAISAFAMIVLIPLVMIFIKKTTAIKELKKKYILLCIFYGANVLNALFSCFWMYPAFVNFRINAGGILKTFQLNRIYWIMPACWMCVLILEIAILLDIAKMLFIEKAFKKVKILSALPLIFVLLISFAYAKNVYLSSTFYHNIRLVFFPDTYHVDTWKKYYDEELMDEIAKAIGREKSDYRIVSVGMNPAVSLFNGFYTVDGYSTDYPLEYKHEFREIIKDELAKDEGVRGYFDDWGNRCYIFSAELPVSTGLNNPTDEIENLAIDTGKLREMGADYIFSAAEIKNADELNLTLLTDEPFKSSASGINVRVYVINQ